MKTIFAALSLVALSTTAFASPTQFSIPQGQATRAEVQAAIGQPGRAMDLGEATNFGVPAAQRSRAEVGAELRTNSAADRTGTESSRMRMAGDARLYVGG